MNTPSDPAPELPRSTSDARFVVFAFSWALVVLFGMSSERMSDSPASVGVCLACGLVLMAPRSTWTLGLSALSYIAWSAVEEQHEIFVHTGFDLVGCVGVLLALVLTFHRDGRVWRQRFVDAFAPVAVAQAALCFFAAGFAKLNTDYLEVKTSCGAVFYAHQITAFPYSLLPAAPWAEQVAIYLGLITELVAPWLWLHYRTRRVGFWFGGLLLFLLGTNARARYYVFTGPFLALLTLGFDWEGVRQWLARHPVLGPALTRAWPALRLSWWLTVPIALVVALTFGEHNPGLGARWFVARTLFVVWSVLVFAGPLVAEAVPLARRPVAPRVARLVWVVVVLYTIHEALPYLGLKTKRNFTMAGNLVINTRWTNHLLLKSAPELPFNKMAILDTSSDRTLNRRGSAAWPTWVLYDYLGRHRKTTAVVTIDGKKVRLRGADFVKSKSWFVQTLQIPQTPLRPSPHRCGHDRPDEE